MKLLTFLNSGCFEICLNMLKSAEMVGIPTGDFIIACMDKDVYNALKIKGYDGAFLYMNHRLKQYQNWTFDEQSGFRNIVKYKWKIISEVYKKYPNLMWVDTDIVFKQNPIAILSGNERVLFQTDTPGSTICTGFMVFNETKECSKLIEECSIRQVEDDQLIMNKIALSKYTDNIALLPLDLFPNGYAYYSQNKKENAMIVHNNWMVGIENKVNKFKEEGLWYL